MAVYSASTALVGAAGADNMSGSRNTSGNMFVMIQLPVALLWLWLSFFCAARLCCSVIFSRAGSSIIFIPKTYSSWCCACWKTALNNLARPPKDPRTFSLISCRRIGLRPYSHARASRTSFLANSSVLPVCVVPLSPAKVPSPSSSWPCVLRRCVCGSGDASGEETWSSSCVGYDCLGS